MNNKTLHTAFLYVILVLIPFKGHTQSCPEQGTSIFPDLTGQQLLEALIQEYKTNTVLSYNAAREKMYGEIDNIDGMVEGIYTGYRAPIDPEGDNPRLQAVEVDINAEHTWPQSKGANSATLAHSDMHHLHPAHESANSARSNHPFYEIPDDETTSWWRYDQSVSTPDPDSIDFYSEYRNSHPESQYSGSWEPRESVKGDIARGIFYFYTMYKEQADDADPIFFEVQKSFLRSWNNLDTVSVREYERNCAIASYQGNMVNPFVIDPTLIERAYFEGQISQTNVEFSATYLSFNENRGQISIQLSITNPNPDTATTARIVYIGGSATPSEDFVSFSSQTVTFPVGSLDRQSINVQIIDDDEQEPDETILLAIDQVSGPANAVIGLADTVTITIIDNDGDVPSAIWLNEFHYDNDGVDEGEFVEIGVNAEFADLSDVTVSLYNGSNGSVYNSVAGAEFTKGETVNGITFYYKTFPSNGIQNGSPDGISIDISGELIQFLSYEGTFIANDGPAIGIESIDIGVEQTGSTPIGHSLALAGSGNTYEDFYWTNSDSATIGGVNKDQEILLSVSNEIEPISMVDNIRLSQNYPNPFNPVTQIEFSIKHSGQVNLSVYNVLGQRISTLVDKAVSAGTHSIQFDASQLSTGIYMYRLQAGEQSVTKKMFLSK